MDFSRSQVNQEGSTPEDTAVYVEELAGPDDYWLSITDASRICRVQDVSIRRAIQRKVLPVRRQRAGQNKRTRFVRASDLPQAGFPIIDESAAISTEIGKVDVLSIPRQQQQIVQEHQELVLRMAEMQKMLVSHQQQISTDLRQQQERFQLALQTAREDQASLLTTAQMRIAQEQQKLQIALTENAQHLAAEHQALRQDFTQEQTRTLSRDEQIQTTMSTLAQNLEQEQVDTRSRDSQLQIAIDTMHKALAQEQTAALAREEQVQTTLNALQTTLLEQQKEVQIQLTALTEAQQAALLQQRQTVESALQRVEQETQARLLAVEQLVASSLKQFTRLVEERLSNSQQQISQTFAVQLANLTQTLTQVRQTTESLHQSSLVRAQDLNATLQQQQAQLERHTQLLPHLLTSQDAATWSQALTDLEARLLIARQRELERYQPLLDLLSPERLEVLTHLLHSNHTLAKTDL